MPFTHPCPEGQGQPRQNLKILLPGAGRACLTGVTAIIATPRFKLNVITMMLTSKVNFFDSSHKI